MASTAASVSPAAAYTGQGEVSLVRLYVLRAMYLVLVIGGGVVFVPEYIVHQPMSRGVITSLLCAVWVLSIFGLRYPLQLLPVLLFELLWKSLWLLGYALPQWRSGQLPPTFADDLRAIAAAPLILIPIIPWGYVWRHYLKRPGDRWR